MVTLRPLCGKLRDEGRCSAHTLHSVWNPICGMVLSVNLIQKLPQGPAWRFVSLMILNPIKLTDDLHSLNTYNTIREAWLTSFVMTKIPLCQKKKDSPVAPKEPNDVSKIIVSRELF